MVYKFRVKEKCDDGIHVKIVPEGETLGSDGAKKYGTDAPQAPNPRRFE